MIAKINQIDVEFDNFFINEALSFFPVFKYLDSEDVIIFTSQNMYYHVDNAGQFNENYYGMKHEMIDFIFVE